MEFTYFQSQIYLFEFEPVVVEDIRVVVGIGEHICLLIPTYYFFFNKATFFSFKFFRFWNNIFGKFTYYFLFSFFIFIPLIRHLISFLSQGFSYAYVKPDKAKIEIVVNDDWPGVKGFQKINTVLQYDEDYNSVTAWGAKALAGEPPKRKKNKDLPKPVELFKFHLGRVPDNKKPKLPDNITPERAITDYLREMGM